MRIFRGKNSYNQPHLSVSDNEKNPTIIAQHHVTTKQSNENPTVGTDSNADIEIEINGSKDKSMGNGQNIKEKNETFVGVEQVDKNGKCKFKVLEFDVSLPISLYSGI